MKGDTFKAVVKADLHIHTCLSPCASLDMTPRRIVKTARKRDLDLVAVTDHNSAENVKAVIASARNTDLVVIPGIEVMSAEEVHILGLFQEADEAISMQELVYDRLPPGQNDEELFGLQVVVDEHDMVEEINTRLLIRATTLTVDEVVDAIHQRNGLAVAAHVDRISFSILGQLGFIPEGLGLDAVEVSSALRPLEARRRFKECKKFPLLTSSDAHSPEQIGKAYTLLLIERVCWKELAKALGSVDGRMVIYEDSRF